MTDFLDLQAFPFSSLESYKILMHYATLQLKSPIYAQKQAVNTNATCSNNCTAKWREGTN